MDEVRKLLQIQMRWTLSSILNGNIKLFSTEKSALSVKIPKRIERGPTDILKALAGTVQRDPTALHYKFPDDPYFDIKSNFLRRATALSIESGRKSARWIVENNPEFFNEKISEPFVQSLSSDIYSNTKTESSEVEEKTLISAIEKRNVSDAIAVYDILEEKGCELSMQTRQLLLELICFYNCEENKIEKELESKWYKKVEKKLSLKTWKDKGLAEKLFQKMNADCPLAFSALIQGMLKYGQVDEAFALFNAARDKNLILAVGVYNEILANIHNIKESQRWDYALELLGEMESKKIKPNLSTLNALLETLCKIDNLPNKKEIAMKTLAEFRNLGIQPSLGTYYYLFDIRCRGKMSYKYFRLEQAYFKKILDDLSSKKLEIRHKSDMFFFPYVMEICAMVLKSPLLAHALNYLLMKNDHIKFIGGNLDETLYYKYYLILSFRMEPIESAMNMYENLVPNVIHPDSILNQQILMAINDNEAFEYLPIVWTNIKTQAFSIIAFIAPDLLKMASVYKDDKEEVLTVFLEISCFVFKAMEDDKNAFKNFEVNNLMISNMVITFLKFEDVTKALTLVQMVFDGLIFFSLTPQALTMFYNFCLTKQMTSEILGCLKHGKSTNHPNIQEMAANALPLLSSLSDADLNWISDLANKKNLDQSPGEDKPEKSDV